MQVQLTCSPLPRPSTQKLGKGHEWWKRDVYHVRKNGETTLCGRNCSDWVCMDPQRAQEVLDDRNLCSRCAAKLRLSQ